MRLTTTVEPEWDDATREQALALDLYESSLCPLCGQPSWICQAPENQFSFVVPPPVRCHATTALHAAQSRVTEDTNPQHQALLWHTTLSTGG